jgi:hypothetical protein
VLEIGPGWTSALITDALLGNGSGKLTMVTEHPTEGLRRLPRSEIMEIPLISTGGKLWSQLEDGDILSIDSSHVMGDNNDVALYLQFFLPALKPGVLVHIHDIFLPDAYPDAFQKRGYDEQDHLAVFLNSNTEWKIEFAANWFSKQEPDELKAQFVSFTDERTPGSFWIRKEMTKREAEVVLKRKPTKPKKAPVKKTITRSFTADTVVEAPHEFKENRGGVNCITCGKPEDEGLHE